MKLDLSPALTALLEREQDALTRLKALLESLSIDPDVVAQLNGLIEHLDALFLVVVVGEFNAGKSSVLNALFGEKIMEEGPIPTTAKITILRYGEAPLVRQLSDFLIERRHPAPLLEHLNLVDTPGTNSIVQAHQRITEDFIPRADLVLFVTSFDRPLSESERTFLAFIRDAWGKRLVFVLNKADLARSDEALAQVMEHIRSGCRELMNFEPRIFPVSAEQAYEAKTSADAASRAALWKASRFEAFETFLTRTLAGPERLAIKLTAPLDTARRLMERVEGQLRERQAILAQDEEVLQALRSRVETARTRLAGDYARHLAEIDTLVLEMEQRGVQFLDDTLRVSKIGVLRDRDRFKEEFGRQVIRQADRQIEDRLTEAVDALLKQALGLWNQTLGEFTERLRDRGRRFAPAQEAFSYNRAEVFGAMMREAERKIETYDLNEEARRILENAREAADLFQYTEYGAAGIGALAGLLLVTTALDAVGGVGLFSAGALAVVGFTYLPRQRRKAIAEFRERIVALRTGLKTALEGQSDREINAALAKIREMLTPFADYVEQEQTTLSTSATDFDELSDTLSRLREAVHDTVGSADVERPDAAG